MGINQSKISRRQEKAVAEDLGGRRQAASGALPGYKGDVRREDLRFPMLVECKRTGKASISVKLEHLVKISKEAAGYGAHPAFVFEFDSGVTVPGQMGWPVPRRWVAVPISTMRGMLEAIGEEQPEL